MLIDVTATWQYQSATNTVPSDPNAVTVPSGGWSTAAPAPFGHAGAGFAPEDNTPIGTAWAVNTALWLRRNVTVSGDSDILLKGFCENAVFVYFNGVYVGAVNRTDEDRTTHRRYTVVIPKSMATAGAHTLALFCMDEAGGTDGSTYISLKADYTPAMLPHQPRAPVKETLEWLTEIQPANDGSEIRNQLRVTPRQKFQFYYPAGPDQMQAAFNAVFASQALDWLLPVWTQGQHIGAVSAGYESIAIPTDEYDYGNAKLALIWQAFNSYQLVAIDRVTSGLVTLAGKTNLFIDAWFIPVVDAFIPKNAQKRFSGYNAEHGITFQVTDALPITVSAPASFTSTLGTADIYYDEGLLDGDALSDDFLTQIDFHDEDLGFVTRYAPWRYNRVARSHNVLCEDRSEAWTLRQWLYRRAGKCLEFYQPSFENDLRSLSTGTVTNTLDVSADELRKYGSVRRTIAVETTSGWHPAEITGTTAIDASKTRLTLDRSLSVAASTILRVCWLGVKRLDADSIDIQWIGGGVCSAQVRLLELRS